MFTRDENENAMAELMLNMMGAFAQFERSLIKERQRERMALAKLKGVFKGRKRAITDDRCNHYG